MKPGKLYRNDKALDKDFPHRTLRLYESYDDPYVARCVCLIRHTQVVAVVETRRVRAKVIVAGTGEVGWVLDGDYWQEVTEEG